jgi:hypothetical protein
MKDPVIEELWGIKDQIARECNNDLEKLAAMIRRREAKDGVRVVDLSKSAKKKH